jgi:murein DD-endopeptidase
MSIGIRLQSPWIPLRLLLAMLAAAIAGCAGSPDAPDRPAVVRASDETARKAVDYARDMVGKPYKYAGDSPAGFDCSGLVRYSYGKAGLQMPRDTRSQRNASVPVSLKNLREGDLLFFDQEGKKASHVGMYIGNGRFVHAPSSGGKVRTDSLKAEFWKKHFVDARRV